MKLYRVINCSRKDGYLKDLQLFMSQTAIYLSLIWEMYILSYEGNRNRHICLGIDTISDTGHFLTLIFSKNKRPLFF